MTLLVAGADAFFTGDLKTTTNSRFCPGRIWPKLQSTEMMVVGGTVVASVVVALVHVAPSTAWNVASSLWLATDNLLVYSTALATLPPIFSTVALKPM